MYVLQVGGKYLCGDEAGYTWLGTRKDKYLFTWLSYDVALEDGKEIFEDPDCHKFAVVEIEGQLYVKENTNGNDW